MNRLFAGLTVAAIACTAGAVSAQDAPFAREISARQGIMTYRAIQLGALGAMAKGEVEYNTEAAQSAADNLLAISVLDTSMLWPQGSGHDANPDSDVAPSLWDPASDIGGKAKALAEAATAMQAAAGQGLDSLRSAMGPVGEACGGCHKVARVPD